jgi:8-oxo-dGTP diphosphatase
MPDPIRVACAIIKQDGNVLIAKRRQGLSNGGRWEFPGGTLEPGESPEAALMRELDEEFGARAQVLDLVGSNIHAYPNATVELMAYRVKLLTADMVLKEHDEIQWVRPADLPAYDLTEADRPIAALLR